MPLVGRIRLHYHLAMITNLFITIIANIISLTEAFSSPQHHLHSLSPRRRNVKPRFQRNQPESSPLNLIPLSEVWDLAVSRESAKFNNKNGNNLRSNPVQFSHLVPKLGCKSLDSNGALMSSTSVSNDAPRDYRLYLATHFDDLPPITHLTLQVFDATAITLSSTSNWSAFEKAVVGAVVEPAIAMYNSYANAVGYMEVLSGLRRRMTRIIVDDAIETDQSHSWLSPLVLPDGSIVDTPMTQKQFTLEEIAAQSSLIIALARVSPDGNLEAAASVELRLQPTDAKIPFSQPWLDNVERKLVRLFPFVNKSDESTKPPLRPYLCNLCVLEGLRNLGIGRALCRIVEAIASQQWGYDHLYLHVDPTNDAARILYENEGYVDVGKRWNVLWAGGADGIGYYVKKL